MTKTWSLVLVSLALTACATTPLPTAPAPEVPPQWHAPLPHGGTLEQLSTWWARWDDPALAQLLDAAQQASPTLASARSRVEQARATRTSAGAALLPSLDASASSSRGFNETLGTVATTHQVGLQAAWEIDLFGGNRAARDAAEARYAGAQAAWHDARVAVAA